MKIFEVLLADDHAIIRNNLKQILADTENIVVAGEATNGMEVLQQVRRKEWDVLVLDLSMPGQKGMELIQLIKAEKPTLPILVFSMHNEKQYAARALCAGASDYLTKDSDGDLLVAAIMRLAKGQDTASSKRSESRIYV